MTDENEIRDISFNDRNVDAWEDDMRKVEARLEQLGRRICRVKYGGMAWMATGEAVKAVQAAIRQAWRMRPTPPCFGIVLAALLSVGGAFTAAADGWRMRVTERAMAGVALDGLTDGGVDVPRLMDAIAFVESDRGATSRNVYQLKPIYYADVRRIGGLKSLLPYERGVRDETVSRLCMLAYWQYYGNLYVRRTGRPLTAEVMARMHNGGPNGWKKPATRGYWRRVKRIYERNWR